MYKLYIVTFLFLNGFLITAQNTFEFILSGDQDQFPNSLIYDNSGNIICSAYVDSNVLIFKINSNGQLIDSLLLKNSKGECVISCLLRSGNNSFYGLGKYEINTIDYLWFIEFDYNLNIISEYKNELINLHGYAIHSIINHRDNIVLTGHIDNKKESLTPVIELNSNGEIVQSKIFSFFGMFNAVYDITQDLSTFCYKIFPYNPFVNRTGHIVNIDTCFNIINQPYVGEYLADQNTVKWTSSNTYMVTTKKVTSNSDCQMGVLKLSKYDEIIDTLYFGDPQVKEYPGILKNMDFIDSDHIYYTGTSSIAWPDPFSPIPSWMLLTKLDTNLNIQWQKYYGGDANYYLISVLATQDSGLIMACSKFDNNIPDNYRDIYILKVDKDGLTTSSNYKIKNKKDLLIYPNPGNQYLYIKNYTAGYIFNIHDITGKLLISAFSNNEILKIDTGNLNSGIYLLRYIDNDGLSHFLSKWIKL